VVLCQNNVFDAFERHVDQLTEKFGGGGHKNAAGCSIEGNWNECERNLVAAMIEAVEGK